MGSTPTTDNTLVNFIDGLVHAGFVGGEEALKAFILTTPLAWLEGPVIHIFTDEVIKYIGSAMTHQAQNMVAKIVIDVQTNLEKSAAKKAVDEIQKAKASGDADAIRKANEDFNRAMASLIHSDGSAHP